MSKFFNICPIRHRCRSRPMFGRAKDLYPNFPKHARKVFVRVLLTNFIPQRSWKPFLLWPPKKDLRVFFCKLWVPFLEMKQRWVPFFQDFAQIFRYLSRIFDKSKLLGVRLHLLHPCLLHHCRCLQPTNCPHVDLTVQFCLWELSPMFSKFRKNI